MLPDRRDDNNSPQQEGLWLMSFSDMSLIMLSFFLMLLSMSRPNDSKMQDLKEGLTEKKSPVRQNFKKENEKLKKLIQEKHLQDKVTIEGNGELSVEFKEDFLFSSGSSELKEGPNLNKILKILAPFSENYRFLIEGHTDDLPVASSSPYPSNWELSAARGFCLMKKFSKLGVKEERLSVTAFAHTRPKIPIKNLQEEEKQKARAANRRVVLKME